MRPPGMKVGQVARRTGLTVRTLHHYDAIGLLSPSAQTGSGHRLYTPDDVARLQQIVSLRQLGFSLEQIGKLLRQPDCSLTQVVELHLEAVKTQLDKAQQLCRQLEVL